MKITLIIIAVVFLTLNAFHPCFSQNQNDAGVKKELNVQQWIEENFAKNKVPPFSFIYGGKDSKSFITQWEYKAESIPAKEVNTKEFVYSYSDNQSGLVVNCYVTCFNDFNAVEWTLKLSNKSSLNSPLIEKATTIDYVFSNEQTGKFILHHAKGSNAERTDFQPLRDELQIGQNIYMTPVGGRSSDNTAFPFFNVEEPGQHGIMVAVGWTGKWYADLQQTDDKSFSLKSGMEKMQLVLYPNEEIRTPKICLLFWNGEDRMVGHNQFRQFILAHHTRKINGKHVELPFSAFLAREGLPPCNEHTCATESFAVAMINRHKQFNLVPEVFWLDAGWYSCNGSWPLVGNWSPNIENFPNGLKPVTDAAHKAGAKFLLWFEPERVTPGTLFADKNPDWLLKLPGNNNSLFNLGNNDARLWLTDYISDFLKKEGVDYYRQDFNFDPMPYWEANDKPDRIGISEIRHIEGLYAFWDSLLVRFPNILIDNCASGGRRIDLETVSRSSPLWRTDYSYGEPNGSQCHAYGLNFYLPLSGTGNFTISPYNFRSNMSSSMVINWDLNSKEHSAPELQKYFQDFKRLRPYFYEDFYPLTDYGAWDYSWMAYQLNRPKQNDGVIFAFRRSDCSNGSINIKLKGLDDKSTYEVFYEDYGLKIKMAGIELMKGFDIKIPIKPGSLLISYKKI